MGNLPSNRVNYGNRASAYRQKLALWVNLAIVQTFEKKQKRVTTSLELALWANYAIVHTLAK